MYLMEQLQRIYDDIKDNNEFMIIEKYESNAKHYTVAFISEKMSSDSYYVSYFKFINEPLLKPLYEIKNILNHVKHRTVYKLKCTNLLLYY